MVDKFFFKLLHKKLKKSSSPIGFETPFWVQSFLENFEIIQREFENYKLNCNSGDLIDGISNDQRELNLDKKWRAIFLYGYNFFNKRQKDFFPKTFEIIEKHRNKINLVMFSTTEPGKHIPPHKGNNYGVLRLQIGVDIAEPNMCTLRVDNKQIHLYEKEIIIFDDTFEHELKNESNSNRTVLIIDYYKPLPIFYHILNILNNRKISKSKYVKDVIKKLN